MNPVMADPLFAGATHLMVALPVPTAEPTVTVGTAGVAGTAAGVAATEAAELVEPIAFLAFTLNV